MKAPVLAWLQAFAARLGTAGVIGLGLLIFTAVFWTTTVAPAAGELEAAERRLAAQAERRRSGPAARAGNAAESASPQQRLEKFLGHFPPVGEASKRLLEVYAAAEGNGISLEAGEYKLVEAQNGKLARYEIRLPVKGPYVNVRRFTLEALERVPAMSLDAITIKRDAIGSPAVDARVQFTLYLVEAT